MKWILLSYIILNPLFYFPGTATRDIQQLFYQISSMCVFVCGFFFSQKTLKLDKINITLGIMILAFLLAWVKSLDGWWGIGFNYLLGFMVYITIIKTLDKEDINFILKGLTLFVVFITFWLLLQYLGFDMKGTTNVGDWTRTNTNSIFYQRSAMGIYFAQVIPMITSFTPVAFLLFLPVGLSESMGAIFGGGIGFMFFLWFRKRIIFWCLLIPVIVGSIFLFMTKENSIGKGIRFPIWKAVINDIASSPFGHGLNSFSNPPNGLWRYYQYPENNKVIRIQKKKDKWIFMKTLDKKFMKSILSNNANLRYIDHPHNEYLWIGYELGNWSLIVIGFLFYFVWMRFWHSQKDVLTVGLMGSLIAFALISLTQFPLHLSRVGYMLPIIGALFYLQTEENV